MQVKAIYCYTLFFEMEDNPHPLLRCTQPFIKKPGKPNNSYQSKTGEKNVNNPEATTIPMVQSRNNNKNT
jgi:hypothetical protein